MYFTANYREIYQEFQVRDTYRAEFEIPHLSTYLDSYSTRTVSQDHLYIWSVQCTTAQYCGTRF